MIAFKLASVVAPRDIGAHTSGTRKEGARADRRQGDHSDNANDAKDPLPCGQTG
jgi:hypothetical protein